VWIAPKNVATERDNVVAWIAFRIAQVLTKYFGHCSARRWLAQLQRHNHHVPMQMMCIFLTLGQARRLSENREPTAEKLSLVTFHPYFR